MTVVPEQMLVLGNAETEMVGVTLTVTLIVAGDAVLQPKAVVAVTEYVVVTVGLAVVVS